MASYCINELEHPHLLDIPKIIFIIPSGRENDIHNYTRAEKMIFIITEPEGIMNIILVYPESVGGLTITYTVLQCVYVLLCGIMVYLY